MYPTAHTPVPNQRVEVHAGFCGSGTLLFTHPAEKDAQLRFFVVVTRKNTNSCHSAVLQCRFCSFMLCSAPFNGVCVLRHFQSSLFSNRPSLLAFPTRRAMSLKSAMRILVLWNMSHSWGFGALALVPKYAELSWLVVARTQELMTQTNVFARILRKEIPCKFIHEDDKCVAFNDPQGPVHFLVIPKQGIASLAAVQDSIWPL